MKAKWTNLPMLGKVAIVAGLGIAAYVVYIKFIKK